MKDAVFIALAAVIMLAFCAVLVLNWLRLRIEAEKIGARAQGANRKVGK